MKTRDLLRQATAQLEKSGCDSARLDSELLLTFLWQVTRSDLIIRAMDEVPAEIELRFSKLLERRSNREPLAYIIGEREFWSRPFRVSSAVLIPRPETEHLIEAVLQHYPSRDGAFDFCDIGTGSGCIGITLACEFTRAHVVATDISEAALDISRYNAKNLHVEERIRFRQGDMLQALNHKDGPFDAIISNPPYVALDEMAELEAELSHEPRTALTDESDGLTFLSTILKEGARHLKRNGHLIVETGSCGLPETPQQLQLLNHIFDYAGHLRGAIYQKTY